MLSLLKRCVTAMICVNVVQGGDIELSYIIIVDTKQRNEQLYSNPKCG